MKRAGAGSRVAIISVLLLGLVIFGAMYYTWNIASDIFQPVNAKGSGKTIPFEIKSGETTTQIGDKLQESGLIRNSVAFRIWARIKGLDTHLQAGIYEKLSSDMTISQIIDQLLNAQPDAVRVVIPEGWRIEQIATRFADSGLVKFKQDEFLKYAKNIKQFPDAKKYAFLTQAKNQSMEGLLFPASYEVPVNGTARDVVNMMLKAMDDNIKQNQLDKLAQAHQMSLYQMIIFASIVEREVRFDGDRQNIASVYWNRIYRQNDETVGLLQADPTVQYARDTQAKPKTYWSPLEAAGGEVAQDSPWNTYTKKGLPPTPICSPGLASMLAAANPPKTDYYFFLAKKDGHSVFAKTLAEFHQYEQQYLP